VTTEETAAADKAPLPSMLSATTLPTATARWLTAVVRTSRPQQWPKNLLVFAAPLAGATLGRDDGLAYALVAAAAFGCASAAVYLVNDVVDAERDRLHPVKRNRPIASGALPKRHAIVLAALAAACALAAGIMIGEPLLAGTTGGYLCLSFLYSALLKHVPFIEMAFVASGFLLRVLGGSVATHVKPSIWFLLVCSLGALGVAVAKRYSELTGLGKGAIPHRPVMRWYQPGVLRAGQLVVGLAMLATYLMWAASENPGARGWHLASALPLAVALARFCVLTGRRTVRPVEDMITRDGLMLACEVSWLALFCAGLYLGG
jgi:decaprenyl-phosphate phosphoribosyltransferase